MEKLSAYVLALNSERHLAAVLTRLFEVADEVIVLDSGSTDRTLEIAARFQAEIHHREFDDFISQRMHAAALCRHEWVLFVDSDEIPDPDLLGTLRDLKAQDFGNDRYDSFRIRRDWFVLGRPVHSIHPIKSPDFPIRLYMRSRGQFKPENVVHEKLDGLKATGTVERGTLHHYTFESDSEFARKLTFYGPLAAEAHRRRNKHFGRLRGHGHAMAAWFKSYVIRTGWRDGRVGLVCASYAYSYTLRKYAVCAT